MMVISVNSLANTLCSSCVGESTKVYFCFNLQAKYDANRRKQELPVHTKHVHVNNVTNNHAHYHLV